MASDRTHRVKDAEDYRRAVAAGHVSAGSAAHVEIELTRVIERVRRWDRPFSEDHPAGLDPAGRVVRPAVTAGARW
ncbi:hypothetical protein ACGFJ7_24495 [Actinoplanes sp. NPDC048988]|uniref:hypothetical protein n=1 Tax=Actinoplanes sp. NPDC048988 TaxID=3363901 RepID=UPI0037208AC2